MRVSTEPVVEKRAEKLSRPARVAVVAIGIFFGQFVLYAPSLLGYKIQLPLNVLAELSMYMPRVGGVEALKPHDPLTSDLVLYQEPERVFAHREIYSGRFPLWSPYRFGGSPAYPLALSPPWVLAYLIESPVVVAWANFMIAMIAGFGAYVFCRVVVKVGFWPAAIAGWCYPITGAYIVWQGFWLPGVMCWLPWVLLAVDRSIRNPLGWGPPSLAGLTMIVLISGSQDIAGQVLLTSGLFGIWSFLDEHGIRRVTSRSVRAAGITGGAWLLGILAAVWLILPMAEYVKTGVRMVGRVEGVEERPPIGLQELPQLVLPEMYGSTEYGSLRIVGPIVQEGSIAGYSGLLTTLLLAPLAFCSRRHRSLNIFWLLLIFISMSWLLNVPGMVQFMRLPGMNIMSHNRLVFVASLAILSMAAVGIEVLLAGQIDWRKWFFVPLALVAVLYGWCVYRAIVLPEPLATNIFMGLNLGQIAPTIRNIDDAHHAQDRFTRGYVVAAVLCSLVMAGWIAFPRMRPIRRWVVPALAVIMMADLLWFAWGRAPQSDPALYYPDLPIFQTIRTIGPGRVMGFSCLPANLSQVAGLADIRGYDGVDPDRMVELLTRASVSESPIAPYARTQMLAPVVLVGDSHDWSLKPVFDMLNVRYVLFRGPPIPHVRPDMVFDDYWALVNQNVLPRAFVPRRVEMIADPGTRVQRLVSDDFNPREVAFVEEPVELPYPCQGMANIRDEDPTHVTIDVDMSTPGLVVLSDIWDVGWRAYLDNKDVPILRTNHAVRGVVVPAGHSTLQFRYEPASLYRGLRFSMGAWVVLAFWFGFVGLRNQGKFSDNRV